MDVKLYTEYCTGCGLCKSMCGVPLVEDSKGYLAPCLNQGMDHFCSIVCPASGNALNNYQNGTIWGEHRGVFLGWSTNHSIRHDSSSGGVLTTLCV